VTDFRRIEQICDLLVKKNYLREGHKQDILNRGQDQARHILLDRRAEMRRLLGRSRVDYSVHEIEVVTSFRFPRADDPLHLVDEELVTRMLAEEMKVPFRFLDPIRLDYKLVTETFGGPFAERHLVVPLADGPRELTVAVASPWDRVLIDNITRVKNKQVKVEMAMKSQIIGVVVEFHGFRRSMRAAEAEFSSDLPDLGNLEGLYDLKDGKELDAQDQPVVKAVGFLLHYAFEQRASDIHIEPKRDGTTVRMRIDGVLHQIHRLPKMVHQPVVSRIKTLARMDIAERRRPQDGRFKTQYKNMEVELRASTVPTAFGEKVVLRVFDPGVLLQDIEQIGMFPREMAMYRTMLGAKSGMVLVTGPTGSGKTTTLYSSLKYLHSPRVNIVTLEDPIEMVHEEFNQITMQPKIGLTFGAALRNVLRQDPDVIMVGEVRDQETAENVIQSALTGHLVLSTVHTGEAAAAVGRLMDLGVLPFLLSSVLVGVIAQRLVRKVCPHCAVDEYLTEEQAMSLHLPRVRGRQLRVRRGAGCVRCRFTGYLGRTGLFEVMPTTPRVAQLIADRATTNHLKREALNDGMLTLRDYAIKKLARGETTFDEVVAVTDELDVY
jgi:general secretion pathway protein E